MRRTDAGTANAIPAVPASILPRLFGHGFAPA